MTTILTGGRLTDFGILTIFGGENDGRRAESLRLLPLFRELTRMQIPGIASHMTKMELLAAFHSAVTTIATTKLRSPGTMTPTTLSATVAKQAAELIASGHADRCDTETSAAPQRPIASTSTRATS